ncbi:MAG TPA: hypothetical protein VFZ59_08615 [Verrucomicrobiae bacterium]|nr:hypothetical protein [Verrucomicrobiae bacterium]
MNYSWAIRLSREDAAALSALRQTAGVEVAEAGNDLWIRGKPTDEALDVALSSLPAVARHEWLAANALRRVDQRVPCGTLPQLRWQPLNSWLQAGLPPAALPGNEPKPTALRLERSFDEREPELLLTTLGSFKGFVMSAAQVRLDRLQFAAAADGRLLVRGKPLPPLPGRRFALYQGVAVPAGFTWKPAVSEDVLACRFGVTGDALMLWNEDGTVVRLHGEQFVPASRSAVRATEQGMATAQ